MTVPRKPYYAQDQHGIYGGTTPHERRHLRQQRNRKKAS